MILSELKIHHVRNIVSGQLSLHPRFNFLYGANGSGKTSVLEALYLLSCGHSFRSREISPLITHEQPALTVFARGTEQETISIQKSTTKQTLIKLNAQYCSSTSQLAYALPCQIIYSDIFQIIDAGPSVRRSILDWGLFHVEHAYLSILKNYNKVLKHRNILLKKRAAYASFIPWDEQLDFYAQQLDYMRADYFNNWKDAFADVLSHLTDVPCDIEYYKGWDKKKTGKALFEILAEQFESDSHRMFTQHGPHQADLIIESNQFKAKQCLSRGQQKIILMAIKISQADLLTADCLFLIDDFAAELDQNHQSKLMSYLLQRPGQYVISSTDAHFLHQYIPQKKYCSYLLDNGLIKAGSI